MPLLTLPPMATAIPVMGPVLVAIIVILVQGEASIPVEVTTTLHNPVSQVRDSVRDSQVAVPIPPMMVMEDLEADRLDIMNMALGAGATPAAVEMTHQPTEELVPTIQVVTNPTVLILLVV
jgi:hypothetical protein